MRASNRASQISVCSSNGERRDRWHAGTDARTRIRAHTHAATATVWSKLEEQNPRFFTAYELMLKMYHQASEFNVLVAERCTSHCQPSNAATQQQQQQQQQQQPSPPQLLHAAPQQPPPPHLPPHHMFHQQATAAASSTPTAHHLNTHFPPPLPMQATSLVPPPPQSSLLAQQAAASVSAGAPILFAPRLHNSELAGIFPHSPST